MKKHSERRNKKYKPSTTTLSGIKTTWGRALMIDYSFMSADPYKNPVKFKYNKKIREVIINSESENNIIPRHEFSRICSEIMFKCESESKNNNKKESRFDINIVIMAILSSKVNAYPVKNPDGNAYHTSIASVINITTLSIREIDFLKVAFAGGIDYEIGTVSAEILYSELDPNEDIVKNYVNATPVIMINHVKDVVKSQLGLIDISDDVCKEIAEYSASLNIDKDAVVEISENKNPDMAKIVNGRSRGFFGEKYLFNKKLYSLVMIVMFCVLINRIFYHMGLYYGVKEVFSTVAIALGIYILRGRLSTKSRKGEGAVSVCGDDDLFAEKGVEKPRL